MTILSALHSSRIRNRSMGVLHLIAADESCEVSDILALIGDLANSPSSTASRPTSTPAARTYPPVPVAVQAEDAAPRSSATPSPEPQPTSTPAVQALDPLVPTQAIAVDSSSLPGAEGAVDLAPILAERAAC